MYVKGCRTEVHELPKSNNLDAVVVVLDEHDIFGFEVTMNDIHIGCPQTIE